MENIAVRLSEIRAHVIHTRSEAIAYARAELKIDRRLPRYTLRGYHEWINRGESLNGGGAGAYDESSGIKAR